MLGPSNLPPLRSRRKARAIPELAVLSAVVHGHGPHAAEVGELGADACMTLDPERAMLYLDTVLSALNPDARRKVEAIMVQKYEYQSDFVRKLHQQQVEAIAEARARGEAEGKAQGEAEGEARGEARGKAEDVLRVLEARGFAVPDEVAERVRACRDIATLDAWLTRAVTLTDIAELFG